MYDFVWADLSSYDREKSNLFYEKVFGWNYVDVGDGDYFVAMNGGYETAAVFTTPEFLQKIQMPSFWMSYISVPDVEEIIAKAKNHAWAIVEMWPLPGFHTASRVALIRDPSGAGFTVVDGMDTPEHRTKVPGHVCWNSLFLEDVQVVKSFYEDLFDWKIEQDEKKLDRYHILHNWEIFSLIHEIPESYRGPKKRWWVFFATDDIVTIKQKILDAGGEIIWEYMTEQGKELAVYDDQWAHFVVREVD